MQKITINIRKFDAKVGFVDDSANAPSQKFTFKFASLSQSQLFATGGAADDAISQFLNATTSNVSTRDIVIPWYAKTSDLLQALEQVTGQTRWSYHLWYNSRPLGYTIVNTKLVSLPQFFRDNAKNKIGKIPVAASSSTSTTVQTYADNTLLSELLDFDTTSPPQIDAYTIVDFFPAILENKSLLEEYVAGFFKYYWPIFNARILEICITHGLDTLVKQYPLVFAVEFDTPDAFVTALANPNKMYTKAVQRMAQSGKLTYAIKNCVVNNSSAYVYGNLVNICKIFEDIRIGKHGVATIHANMLVQDTSRFLQIVKKKKDAAKLPPLDKLKIGSVQINSIVEVNNAPITISLRLDEHGNSMIIFKLKEELEITLPDLQDFVKNVSAPIVQTLNDNQCSVLPLSIPKHIAPESIQHITIVINIDLPGSAEKLYANIKKLTPRMFVQDQKHKSKFYIVQTDYPHELLRQYLASKNFFDTYTSEAKNYETYILGKKYFNIFDQTQSVSIEVSGISYQDLMWIYEFFAYATFISADPNLDAAQTVDQNNTFASDASTSGSLTKSRRILKSKKFLEALKTNDPLLFGFKKVYGLPDIYSTKCQKARQPIPLASDQQPSSADNNVIKYWNFTRNVPQFYTCPTSEYPNIHFITGIHPRGFCLPCCGKKSSDQIIKKQEIYQKCMEEKKYDTTSTDAQRDDGNRYVRQYGPNLLAGKIMFLPPLLNNLFKMGNISSVNMSEECINETDYHIYGLTQLRNGHLTTTIIDIINKISSVERDSFIEITLDSLSEPDNAAAVLNILLHNYGDVIGTNKLVDIIDDFAVLSKDPAKHQPKKYVTQGMFNMLAYCIAQHCWGVNIIHLDESGNDFIFDTQIMQNNKKESTSYLVVIGKDNGYFPIYYINRRNYTRYNKVDTELFSPAYGIVRNVLQMYNAHMHISDLSSSSDTTTISQNFLYTNQNVFEAKKLIAILEKLGAKYVVHELVQFGTSTFLDIRATSSHLQKTALYWPVLNADFVSNIKKHVRKKFPELYTTADRASVTAFANHIGAQESAYITYKNAVCGYVYTISSGNICTYFADDIISATNASTKPLHPIFVKISEIAAVSEQKNSTAASKLILYDTIWADLYLQNKDVENSRLRSEIYKYIAAKNMTKVAELVPAKDYIIIEQQTLAEVKKSRYSFDLEVFDKLDAMSAAQFSKYLRELPNVKKMLSQDTIPATFVDETFALIKQDLKNSFKRSLEFLLFINVKQNFIRINNDAEELAIL